MGTSLSAMLTLRIMPNRKLLLFTEREVVMNTHYLELSSDSYQVQVPNVADGKRYTIVGQNVLDENGVSVGMKTIDNPRRTAELDMLKGLAEVAANNAKSRKDSNLMLDVLGMLENLQDDKMKIEFDKRDLDALGDAYDTLAGKRPSGWMKFCRAMIRQLAEPQKIS